MKKLRKNIFFFQENTYNVRLQFPASWMVVFEENGDR